MRRIIVLLCLLISGRMAAQDYNVSIYTSGNGLPITCLSTVYFDSHGYLWTGTPSGFSRFDGRSFTNYGIKDGLKENNAGFIFEDSRHRIWANTENRIYLFTNNRFTEIPVKGSGHYGYIYVLTQLHDSTILFSGDLGTYAYNGKEFVPYSLHGFPSTTIFRSIVSLPGNRVVVNTFNAVYEKIDKQDWVTLFNTAGQKEITSLYYTIAYKDKVFFTADKSVYEITGRQLVRKIFAGDEKTSEATHCLFDHKGNLWVTTEASAVYCRKPDGSVLHYGKEYGISNYAVSEITEDNWGNIWAASYQGLIRFTPSFIKQMIPEKNPEDRLLRSIYQSQDYLYLLGGNKAIYRFDEKGEVPFLPATEAQIKKIQNGKLILGITSSPDGATWFCNTDGDVFRITNSGINKIALPRMFSKVEYVNGILYLLRKNAVYAYRDNEFVYVDSTAEGTPFSWPSAEVVSKSRIWFSDNLRLMMFDGKSIYNYSARLKLKPDMYQCLVKHGNEIWMASGTAGIQRIREKPDGTVISLPEITLDGRPVSDMVLSMTFDLNDNLWYSTTKGLQRATLVYHKDSVIISSVKKISESEGLHNSIWDSGPVVSTPGGNVIAGTINGAFMISVRNIITDTIPPAIQIENAELLKTTNGWDAYTRQMSGYYALPVNPVLPFTQNSIRFSFNGVTMNYPAEVKFMYRLDGYDKQWSPVSDNRTATYTNLPSGNYNFKVIAVNSDGSWSRVPATFTFTIKPPFWQTWTFRLLAIAFLFFIVYLLIRRRERILREKNKVALQVANLKLQTLQSQMNPHFIFNSLNSVEKYILVHNPEEGARYLSKFSKLIRKILDNSPHSLLPLYQIIETLKMYVELEALRFNREFSYEFITPDEEDEILNMNLPPMLLQPFVENAIWHGLMPKEGNKKLTVIIEKREANLYCIVEDNGVGRKVAAEKTEGHTSRGQLMIKGMLESLQELLHIKAVVDIKDLYDTERKTAGTRVELIIPFQSPKNEFSA